MTTDSTKTETEMSIAKWMDRMLTPRSLVNFCLFVMFFGGATMQFFFQPFVASTTGWGYVPGWQREISFWNLGMISLILFVRSRHRDLDDDIMKGLSVLGLLLGTNHLIAGVQDPAAWLHWVVGVGINYLVPALYLVGKILRWRALKAEDSGH